MHHRSAFTLIELLVVIAILAVLAVVVVLTLNPTGLLQESRDSSRISDMASLNSAIGYSLADNSGESIGSPNTVYVSIPDPVATSTAGDQCQGLGLPALPANYQCAASSTYRLTNGTGWIPVNLQNNTFGSSLSQLPIDPVNQYSSRLYYTYDTDGNGKFETTAAFESSKYQLGGSDDQVSGDGGTLASVYEKGSKIGMEPLDYGDTSLVGYWTLDEGTGTVAYDYSGNNATGIWHGTASGTSGYYSAGKIGGWAGAFDGSTPYLQIPTKFVMPSTFTVCSWVYRTETSGEKAILGVTDGGGITGAYFSETSGQLSPRIGNGTTQQTLKSTAGVLALGGWHDIYVAYSLAGSMASFFVDGTLQGTVNYSVSYVMSTSTSRLIGLASWYNGFWMGYLDDVRIYNRALTAAQVAALYSGGK